VVTGLIIPVLEKLRQEGHEFDSSMRYIIRPCVAGGSVYNFKSLKMLFLLFLLFQIALHYVKNVGFKAYLTAYKKYHSK
jgi:hypothetical protein